MSQKNFILIFNSIDKPLPSNFQMLPKISQSISQELIFNDDHKYQVQSKVSEEVFQEFYQYLLDGTEPEIHFDTIYEFKQLSQEFEIQELKLNIEKKKNQWREIEKFFQQQPTINSTQNDPNLDQTIAQIFQILDSQRQQIENLTKQIQSQKIEHDSNNMEEKRQFDFYKEHLKQIIDENQRRENEINQEFNKIEEKMQSKNNQIESQNSTIQNQIEDLTNKLEILKSQIELMNNQNSKQQKSFIDYEKDTKAQFETINNQFETIRNQFEKYITKDI